MEYIAYSLLASMAVSTLITVGIMAFVPDEQDREYR